MQTVPCHPVRVPSLSELAVLEVLSVETNNPLSLARTERNEVCNFSLSLFEPLILLTHFLNRWWHWCTFIRQDADNSCAVRPPSSSNNHSAHSVCI